MTSSPRNPFVLLIVLVLAAGACTSGGTAEDDDARGNAQIDDVRVVGNPNSSLSATVEVDTDGPAAVEVRVSGPEREFTVASADGRATRHEIPIVGMRPETTYSFVVDAGAEESTAEFTTGALPPDFPPLEVTSEPDRVAEGLTLFDAGGQLTGGIVPVNPSYLVAVDDEGIPVWYYASDRPIGDARQLPNGNFLMTVGGLAAREVDVLGDLVHEWVGTVLTDRGPFDVDGWAPGAVEATFETVHHELGVLPNGNLLAATSRVHAEQSDTPLCGEGADFPGVYNLVDEPIAEVDPATGEVLREWSMVELLRPFDDPERFVCPFDSPVTYALLYVKDPQVRDWAHVNAAVLDEERNAILVSLRHADLVLAFRYEDDEEGPSGELLWSFGPEGDVTLEDGDWSYHQHAVELQPDGSILLFDNGNERPLAAGEVDYSRAVQYAIDDSDPADVVAREVWSFTPTISDGEPTYSAFVGDADRLDDGNVLVAAGGAAIPQIVEVEPDEGGDGGEVVFDLRIPESDTDTWVIYRAERIQSLYTTD